MNSAFDQSRTVLPTILAALILVPPTVAAQPVFDTDVMAVFSKAGCNAGACHGNQNGKGGFKLSLRGQDPRQDYETITRGFASRRVNLLEPDESLILLKPTAQLPHQGGKRFRRDSLEYQILHDWLAAGAPPSPSDTPRLVNLDVSPGDMVVVEPAESVQLQVTATFDDGSRRDVSQRAVYETSNLVASVSPAGLVRRQNRGETTVIVRFLQLQTPATFAFVPDRKPVADDAPPNNYVDQLVHAKLNRLRITPSELCDDSTFVRRAFLDALGVLPTADEARRFVCDSRTDKRARLIDDLLARPEFSDHWALKWSDLLGNEEKVLDVRGVDVFHGWIRDSVADGKPVDQFVRELITAEGSTYKNPPANFWRAHRFPLDRAETTARLFLGTRLQCAKCHNHPFERWTQDDYYRWAALFARIDYEIVENKRRDKFDKNEFVGEQIVLVKDEGEVKNARTGQVAEPRLLGADTPDVSESGRLHKLADWLTSDDNRLFARSQVNWIWYHVMGRGLVEPIDDFRETNPSVNADLLAALAQDFVAHDFDLRHVVRTIMTSRTYQRSAVPNATNRDDQSNFSRAIVRRLTAEQLLDAQCQVTGAAARFAGYDRPMRAGELPGVNRVRRRRQSPAAADRFLRAFGKPSRLMACECERSNETNLTHAFLLIGGQGINDRLRQQDNHLQRLAQSARSNEQIIDELYWSALSRPPTEAEQQAAAELIESAPDRFAALQDLTWALLNAKEFIFRK